MNERLLKHGEPLDVNIDAEVASRDDDAVGFVENGLEARQALLALDLCHDFRV